MNRINPQFYFSQPNCIWLQLCQGRWNSLLQSSYRCLHSSEGYSRVRGSLSSDTVKKKRTNLGRCPLENWTHHTTTLESNLPNLEVVPTPSKALLPLRSDSTALHYEPPTCPIHAPYMHLPSRFKKAFSFCLYFLFAYFQFIWKSEWPWAQSGNHGFTLPNICNSRRSTKQKPEAWKSIQVPPLSASAIFCCLPGHTLARSWVRKEISQTLNQALWLGMRSSKAGGHSTVPGACLRRAFHSQSVILSTCPPFQPFPLHNTSRHNF